MNNLPSVIDTDAFESIERVAELYGQGITSPHTIARRLGIKVVEARQAIAQWHEIIREDHDSRDAARDALNVMMSRYDKLLKEANDNLSNLQAMVFDEKVSAQINTTLKLIGDLDAKRVDLLQKAGLLDAHDLGDELAEREQREAAIINILRNDLCPECRSAVARKLSEITNTVEAEVVYD